MAGASWKALGFAVLFAAAAPAVRAEEPAPTRAVESETTGTSTPTEDGRAWTRSTTGTVTWAACVERDYTIELTGDSGKLDAFLQAIDRSAILETVRTGASGIGRGERILRV